MNSILSALMMPLKGTVLLKEEKDLIKAHPPAGFILFKRNIESVKQLTKLNKSLKSLISPPPLIALDCEGGQVNRLAHLSKSFQWPSPFEMSKLSLKDISSIAYDMACELKSLFFDINFAPVVDLLTVQSELLKTRVFSTQPPLLFKRSEAFIEASLKGGILPCLKHFPGHGGVKGDTHFLLPQDKRTLKELSLQKKIFQDLFKKHEVCIMTAHVEFPNIEPGPATFSKTLLTKTLKKDMGFKGLVFSDDIDMKALKAFSAGESYLLSLQAGCDLVLSCKNSPHEIIDFFKKRVEKSNLNKILPSIEKKIFLFRKKQARSFKSFVS